jgi:TPR repeat protein
MTIKEGNGMRPNTTASATATNPAAKSETATVKTTTPANTRPFPISNANGASDQIKAALDTLGIKLIKSEAERDVLKKLVEDTRATQIRLDRELQENRKELIETRRKLDEQKQEGELSKNRQERLEEKLREAQANNLKITRKMETDDQKRARIQRRMERLELVASEAQSALQSRAMVLLTDQTLAAKSGLPTMDAAGPALPAPVKQVPSSFIGTHGVVSMDVTDPDTQWWKRSLNLSTSVATAAIVAALALGWVMSSASNNQQNAVAFMADGSIAKIDLRNGTLQPLQLQLKTLEAPADADAPKVTANGEPLPQTKPALNVAAGAANPPVAAPARDTSLSGNMKSLEDKAYAGNPEAQHDLAAMYTAGSGVKQDYKRASYWFEQAASTGVANAAYNLGVLNHQGLGVTKDINRALDWYRLAALAGHPEAQYNLGIAYIEGIGTKYNPQLAAGYFQKAALAGITEAAYNLGLILENGLLAEPKPNQAMMWYRVGAEGGSTEAKNALEQIAQRLGLSVDKAGFLSDGTSLSKLVVKSDRNDPDALEDRNNATEALAKAMPDLAQLIPDSDQLVTAQVQDQLTRRNIYDGPEDGASSPKTIEAIKTYQKQQDMKVDGKPTSELLVSMLRASTREAPKR